MKKEAKALVVQEKHLNIVPYTTVIADCAAVALETPVSIQFLVASSETAYNCWKKSGY